MKISREHIIMGLKVALGAAASILLANLMQLQYAATAGIITVLSIMGTKRETLRIAGGRALAYMSAVAIAFVCYSVLGYSLAGFAAYLFVFAVVCYTFRWAYAIAMVSVLMTHFMAAGEMSGAMLVNETMLFATGALVGIAVNLHLRANGQAMSSRLRAVDELMRAALHALSRAPEGLTDAALLVESLGQELKAAESLALSNADNTFSGEPAFALSYVQMRRSQRRILAQMCEAMGKITACPVQQQAVTALIRRVAEEYSMENDVSALLSALQELLTEMRASALPADRTEFESRAVLYYVLLRMKDFLLLKRQFYEEMTDGTDEPV